MTPFRKLHHVCIVVRDLDESVAYYASVGFGPWHPYPPMADYTTIEGTSSREDYLELRCTWTTVGDVQLQLCQPGPGDTPQRRFLDERGEGVYHLGFEVGDIATEDRAAADLGLRASSRGRRDDGSGFTYFDTSAEVGVVLEIRQSPSSHR